MKTEGEESERKRIPCPLDPKHTVFEDNLAKHLKKCNSKEKPKPIYYTKDVNAGCGSEDESTEEIPIARRSRQELDELIVKLRTSVQGLNTKLAENTLSHSALSESLNDPKNGDSALKHLKQQAMLYSPFH
ncbi:hypothetical protein DNTS_027944 [Danionella cerebrum]|uniref:tRNA:m(4)X modification enzyme TRM13 n=1 Tax=Danionella cerebrum TaxID=2873325 RepID=A0A553QWQ2_9TELE|nr:hypothetical protein DNTS_027944 [Danionella translucida]